MMTQLEHGDDLEAWLQSHIQTFTESRDHPATVAADAVQRISVCLGDKVMISCISHIIKNGIESKNWKE